MSTDFIKRYYLKIKKRLDTVNKQDLFYVNFRNAIDAGKNEIFQKHLMETRIFNGDWVDFIEENLNFLDNIIRKPRSFIKSINQVVPVERAKKTTSETVRYLASHSQDIRTIDKRGDVVPKNLLTSYKEEDLGIYENRFIKSLYEKLVMFVEKRYQTIVNLIGTDYINKFYSKSNFIYDEIDIDYELNISVRKKVHDNEAEIKNHGLLDRIEILRSKIISFSNTEFMIAMKNVKSVLPPIQKTNIIMKDPNYRKCYELWLFLDSYGTLEYKVETSAADNLFDDIYLDSLHNLTLLSYATVAANDDSKLGEYAVLPTVKAHRPNTKILNKYNPDESDKKIEMESQIINEYYYQQSRKLYSQRIQDRVNDGETFHAALKDVYQSAFKITERLFNDLLEIPDEIKSDKVALLRYRLRNQKALDQIYKYKQSDLRKMEKEKAHNIKIIEKEKAIIEGRSGKLTRAERAVININEKNILIREQEKELKRIQKQIEREKIKLEKVMEKEKNRIQKEKEKIREKERIKKEKEKEQARIKKEKEKARLAKLSINKKKKVTKKRKTNAKKKTSNAKNRKVLLENPDNKTISKDETNTNENN